MISSDPSDFEESEEPPPPRDALRALRKTVAQVVVVFTIPFVFSIGQAVLGLGKLKVDRSPAAWTVWSVGVALMVAASALAVQALRGRAPVRTGRSTAWWCLAVWAAGLALIILYSEMVPPPHR
jgi:hypothetical protein